MDGLLPPNVSLHESDVLSDGIDTEVQLHVGSSTEGDELVVWLSIVEAGSRRLERVLSTASPQVAADSYNARLQELGKQGFDVGEEVQVDRVQLTRAMPGETEPDKAPEAAGGDEGPQAGGSNLLYG